jgi:hypothetical protein
LEKNENQDMPEQRADLSHQIARAVRRACFRVWMGQGQDPWREQFVQRWKPFTQEALVRALREAEGEERACALFAIGYVAFPGGELLLQPFLHSSNQLERWASALTLGEVRNPLALPVLEQLLIEGLHEIDVCDPYTKHFLPWNMEYRREAALLIAKWGNLPAVPVLRRALRTCWEIDQKCDQEDGASLPFWDELLTLEDYLAYALGQMEAWGACFGLGLPTERECIALFLLVLGSLHLDEKTTDIHLYLGQPCLIGVPFNLTRMPLKAFTTIQGPIAHVLQHRYGFSEQEQEQLREQLVHAIAQRYNRKSSASFQNNEEVFDPFDPVLGSLRKP